MSNLTEHLCKGKCPEFDGEQCHHCLINDSKMEFSRFGLCREDLW